MELYIKKCHGKSVVLIAKKVYKKLSQNVFDVIKGDERASYKFQSFQIQCF